MSHKIIYRVLNTLALCCALYWCTAAANASEIKNLAEQAGFVPHKALYDIKLAETKSGSQITNVTGQMFYEWYPSCDGWISNHRFNLTYEYVDSPALMVSSDFSTFESFDGKKMDFSSQRKRGGEVYEEIRGYADKTTGQATYTIPKGLSYDLPEGAAYPMGHSLGVLEALNQGKKFYTATIFDGSDEDGPVEINAFIGKAIDVEKENLPETIDKTLLNPTAHKIQLAFFPLNTSSSSPDYEMGLVFHDNSVVSDMLVEYDDFAVKQSLIALEKLDSVCEE